MFEGYKTKKSFYKRLPLLRGKAKNKSARKHIIINLSDLENFTNGAIVNIKSVSQVLKLDEKFVQKLGVKVLGNGKLTKNLEVSLPVSNKAKEKIEKAKGKVIV